MNIGSIGSSANTAVSSYQKNQIDNTKPAKPPVTEIEKETKPNVDRVEIDRKKIDEALKKYEEDKVANFKSFISSMVTEQGSKASPNMVLYGENISFMSSDKVDETDESDESYNSVDAVAGRIMDMAISLSGGDSDKIDLLRNAVKEGFKQAGVDVESDDALQISKDTYNEIMDRFEIWEKEGIDALK